MTFERQTPRRSTTRSAARLAVRWVPALALIAGLAPVAQVAADIPLSITPPPHLNLDGQDISEGQLTIEAAVAHSDPGGAILSTTVLEAGNAKDDVVIDAVIGRVDPHFLFQVPDDTEVVQISGHFNASVPDLDPAHFDLTIGVLRALDEGEGNHFIVALPLQTADFLPQVTNLGTNLVRTGDNTTTFCDELPVVSLSGGDLNMDNGIDNPWFASCPNELPSGDGQPHGSIGSGCQDELRLSISGDCPGEVTINVCGGTPGGRFSLLRANAPGAFQIPGGPCKGVQTGLANPVRIGVFPYDPNCCFSFTPNLGDQACGQFLQIIDLTTCEATNVDRI